MSDIIVRQAIVQWLEVAELADATGECYEALIRLHVLSTPGDRAADKVDADLLERLYGTVAAMPGPLPEPGGTGPHVAAVKWSSFVGAVGYVAPAPGCGSAVGSGLGAR